MPSSMVASKPYSPVGEGLTHRLSPLLTDLLVALNYTPPPDAMTDALRRAMVESAVKTGIPFNDNEFHRMCFETGMSAAAHMYPLHPLEVQLHIGMFTWLGFVIDDNTQVGADLDSFQERFTTGQPQASKVLEHFAIVLRGTYKLYDPIIANSIVLSALAFVNSNATETRPEYKTINPTKDAVNWPYYFRDKEGMPEVYAYFNFPKYRYPDISVFLPAIPDMCTFINLTNDILSFYKEEKAGEEHNYMHKMAFYRGQSPIDVLEATISQAVADYRRSRDILKGRHPYDEVWHAYVMGYVASHMRTSRYKLKELTLAEKYLS